jgi:hypothetical protein
VSPPKLNSTLQTHPKEQILLAGPGPILIANTSIWWSRPCGLGVEVSPPKFKFSKQTHSKEQRLFAGPCPIINPSGNFRRGHCAGYPWGLTFWVTPWLYKLFYKHYIIKFINIIEKFINIIEKFINIIEKLINPIVIPQKHDNYTRKVFDGIGEGVGGGCKSDYKDCFLSQK